MLALIEQQTVEEWLYKMLGGLRMNLRVDTLAALTRTENWEREDASRKICKGGVELTLRGF